jgi:hypothetical protein
MTVWPFSLYRKFFLALHGSLKIGIAEVSCELHPVHGIRYWARRGLSSLLCLNDSGIVCSSHIHSSKRSSSFIQFCWLHWISFCHFLTRPIKGIWFMCTSCCHKDKKKDLCFLKQSKFIRVLRLFLSFLMYPYWAFDLELWQNVINQLRHDMPR